MARERDCFNCENYLSDRWAGQTHVVECMHEGSNFVELKFEPFNKMICDNWTPKATVKRGGLR